MSDSNTSEELMLRDKKTGRWIKRSDNEVALSDNFIPRTLVQVINNEVHYTDTKLILSEIISNRKKDKVEHFETEYNSILDYLDNYRAYSEGIEKVFGGCESSASNFDNEIRRLCGEISLENLKKFDIKSFENIVRAYIKILFVYLYSALVLHKGKVKSETVIYGKIECLKSYIQSALESILIPKNWNGSNFDFKSSIYPAFIYSPKLNIEYIDVLVKYDSRFKTSLELIRKINNATLHESSRDWDSCIEFSGKVKKMKPEDLEISFISMLVGLLNDIDRLKNIRAEIGDINDDKILEEFDSHGY